MARGNDGPIDAFRQVTASAMRAIAHRTELSVTFLNKCDETERSTVAEYYQRCFGRELTPANTKAKLV